MVDVPGRLAVISHSRLVVRHSSFSFFHVFCFPPADSKPRFQSISPEGSRSWNVRALDSRSKDFFKTCDENFQIFSFCPISFFARIFSFSIYWDLDLGISFRGNYWEYYRDFSNKNSNVLRALSLILRDEVIYNFLILNILPVETKILNHISTWILHSPK